MKKSLLGFWCGTKKGRKIKNYGSFKNRRNTNKREFFWPLHLQNALPKDYQKKDINLSVSENLGKNGFYLPLGAHINNKKQEFIVNKLLNHLN